MNELYQTQVSKAINQGKSLLHFIKFTQLLLIRNIKFQKNDYSDYLKFNQ